MAAPAHQQTATSYGESVLTTNAPPAYSEKQPLGEGQTPGAQQQGQGNQLPQSVGHYPQQIQVTGGVLPQTWPQGYPVSHFTLYRVFNLHHYMLLLLFRIFPSTAVSKKHVDRRYIVYYALP